MSKDTTTRYWDVERIDNFNNFKQERYYSKYKTFIRAQWKTPASYIQFTTYPIKQGTNFDRNGMSKKKPGIIVRVDAQGKVGIKSVDDYAWYDYKQELDAISPMLISILEWAHKLMDD